jgi:hypothetical protein
MHGGGGGINSYAAPCDRRGDRAWLGLVDGARWTLLRRPMGVCTAGEASAGLVSARRSTGDMCSREMSLS